VPLGPRDIAPFLTPFISANEWSDANARQFSVMNQHNDSILRAQAAKERAKIAAEANQVQRAGTTAYQEEQLKLRKQQQEAIEDERAKEYYEGWHAANDAGDKAAAARHKALAEQFGYKFEPDVPSAPASPLAAPPAVTDVLRSFGAAPAANRPNYQQNMTLADPASAETQAVMAQLPPLAPPPAPQAAPVAPRNVVRVSHRGRPLETVDLDQVEEQRQQRRAAVAADILQSVTPAERPMAEAALKTAYDMPGTEQDLLKNFMAIYTPAANRAERVQGYQLREKGQARLSRTEERRATLEQTKLAEEQRNTAVAHMRKEDDANAASGKVNSYRGLRAALTTLDTLKKNPAASSIFNNQLYTMATSREPGALNRQDISNTVALRAWDKVMAWGAQQITGELSKEELTALRGVMEARTKELEKLALQDYGAMQTFARSMFLPGTVAWEAAQAYQASRYNQMGWWTRQRALERLPSDIKASERYVDAAPSAAPAADNLPPEPSTEPTTPVPLAPPGSAPRPRLDVTAPTTETTGRSSAPMPPVVAETPEERAARRLREIEGAGAP
jgi:hypothetical protein